MGPLRGRSHGVGQPGPSDPNCFAKICNIFGCWKMNETCGNETVFHQRLAGAKWGFWDFSTNPSTHVIIRDTKISS